MKKTGAAFFAVIAGTMVITGCSDTKVADGYESTTEISSTTQDEVQTETTTQSSPVVLASYSLVNEGDLPDGFSEGRCWVNYKDDDGETYSGFIDDTGKLIYRYDKKEEDPYCEHATRFQSGLSCRYSDDDYKFIIIDNNGNELYESKNTETEKYDFKKQYKDRFLVTKHITTYSENSFYYQIIDKEGTVICEYKANESLCEVAEGIYRVSKGGNAGIIINLNKSEIIEYAAINEEGSNAKYLSDDGKVVAEEKTEEKEGGLECETRHEEESKNGYFNEQGERVVKFPDLPDGVEIEYGSDFDGGYAILSIEGADGKTYVTAINEKGEMQYEPIKIYKFYNSELTAGVKGYALVEMPGEEAVSIISPQGTIKVLGVDDCSELGNDAKYIHDNDYSDDFNLILGGFIRMDDEMKKAHGLDNSGLGFVSLDGKKTITTADIYSDSELAEKLNITDYSSSDGDEVVLNGTYSAEVLGGIAKSYFTFKGNNINMSAFGIETDGTYSIKNNKLNIKYSMFGENYDIEYSFKQKGDILYIGGDKFEKE